MGTSLPVLMNRGARVLSSVSLGLAAQALAFGAGILVVRSLDRYDYTTYSLGMAVVSAVIVLADAGINSAMMAAASREGNAGRFRPLLAAALYWRRVVWAIAVAPMIALLLYLLLVSGVTLLMSAVICLLTGALSFNSLSLSLLAIDYQLSGRFKPLQTLDVLYGGVRLVLVGTAALFGVAGVVLYLAIALLIGIAQLIYMSRVIRGRHPAEPVTKADRTLFGRAVRSTFIVSLSIVLGDQLVNVILVQKGNPLAVADIAALSRFSLAFGLLNVVMGNLAAPFVARAGTTRASVGRAAGAAVAAYAVASVAYVFFVIIASPLLLAILGPQYDHLHDEMVVLAVGAALSNFGTYGIGLVTHARGWLASSWMFGVLLAIWAAYGFFIADVSTPLGAVTLAATLGIPAVLSQAIRFVVGFRSLPAAQAGDPVARQEDRT